MILNFRDKDTALIWCGTAVRRLPIKIQAIARRKLRMLNNAATLADLLLPSGNRLERCWKIGDTLQSIQRLAE